MALSFREIYHVREEKTMPLGLVFRSAIILKEYGIGES